MQKLKDSQRLVDAAAQGADTHQNLFVAFGDVFQLVFHVVEGYTLVPPASADLSVNVDDHILGGVVIQIEYFFHVLFLLLAKLASYATAG